MKYRNLFLGKIRKKYYEFVVNLSSAEKAQRVAEVEYRMPHQYSYFIAKHSGQTFQGRLIHFGVGDNLHEMLKPIFWKK